MASGPSDDLSYILGAGEAPAASSTVAAVGAGDPSGLSAQNQPGLSSGGDDGDGTEQDDERDADEADATGLSGSAGGSTGGASSGVGRKRGAPLSAAAAAEEKKARERKRILRNRELARVSNERRKGRIKAMEAELVDTRQTVSNLEESIRSLEAENLELKNLLENKC